MPRVPTSIVYRVARIIRSRVRNLRNEVQARRRVLRINAVIGIYGEKGSGRKTLAYRLVNMNRRTLRKVPEFRSYTGSYIGWFVPGYDIPFNRGNPFNRAVITLTIYVHPRPDMHRRLTRSEAYLYPLGFRDERFQEYCCIIVPFDVRNTKQFDNAVKQVERLRSFTILYDNRLQLFLVGNKHDLRFQLLPENPEPWEDLVSEDACETGAATQGLDYFEVSAKHNMNMKPLFEEILKTVVHTQRNWQQQLD